MARHAPFAIPCKQQSGLRHPSTLANALISQLMLEPNATDQQQANLSTENLAFVTAVRDSIVSMNPALGDDAALLDRLATAFGEAKRIGLTQQELLEEFLYLETEVPGFYRESAVSAWLEKPGDSVDRRFKDLLEVLRRKRLQGPEER